MNQSQPGEGPRTASVLSLNAGDREQLTSVNFGFGFVATSQRVLVGKQGPGWAHGHACLHVRELYWGTRARRVVPGKWHHSPAWARYDTMRRGVSGWYSRLSMVVHACGPSYLRVETEQ